MKLKLDLYYVKTRLVQIPNFKLIFQRTTEKSLENLVDEHRLDWQDRRTDTQTDRLTDWLTDGEETYIPTPGFTRRGLII